MERKEDKFNLIERERSFETLDVTNFDRRSETVYDDYGRPRTQPSRKLDIDYRQPNSELSSTRPAKLQSYTAGQQDFPQSRYNEAQLQSYSPRQHDVPKSTLGDDHPRWQNDPTIIRIQPTINDSNVQETEKLYDFRCLSVFATLCCFFPIGVAAMIYAFKAKDLADRGQNDQAASMSRIAHTLACTSIGVGILIYVVMSVNSLLYFLHIYK